MLQLAGIVPKTLVEYLKEYMRRQHLSQNQLADKIGISSGGMSNIMSGKTLRPRPEVLAQIARATGLSYVQISVMLDPLLKSELERLVGQPANAEEAGLSLKARLVAKEFDKLPAATQEALLTIVLNYHAPDSEKK